MEDLKNFVHDIRNPLSALKLQIKLLMKIRSEGKEIEDLDIRLEKIEKMCERMDLLIETFATQRNQNS